VRDVQQARDPRDHVVLALVDPAVGIGYLPHELDHADLLVVAEVVVQRGREGEEIVGRARGLLGQLQQPLQRIRFQRELAVQRGEDGRALGGLHGGIGAHHLDEQDGRGQLELVFLLGRGERGGGERIEEVLQGTQHAPYFPPSPMARVITSFMISFVPP
jgi:hypothetical protein